MASSENTVVTQYRRQLLCKVTSGAVTTPIPPITKIAFGTGGADSGGNPIPPTSTATGLVNEVAQYPIEPVTYPIPTTAGYYVKIPAPDLAGAKLSEAALVDSAGEICAIRTFATKIKDLGVVFGFAFNDEF